MGSNEKHVSIWAASDTGTSVEEPLLHLWEFAVEFLWHEQVFVEEEYWSVQKIFY